MDNSKDLEVLNFEMGHNLSCSLQMANSVKPDQTAPAGASWSGLTLFVKTYVFSILVS